MHHKIYVAVDLRVEESGSLRPLAILLDGRRVQVSTVFFRGRERALKSGGEACFYECMILGERRRLYNEDNGRWFLEVAENMPPLNPRQESYGEWLRANY